MNGKRGSISLSYQIKALLWQHRLFGFLCQHRSAVTFIKCSFTDIASSWAVGRGHKLLRFFLTSSVVSKYSQIATSIIANHGQISELHKIGEKQLTTKWTWGLFFDHVFNNLNTILRYRDGCITLRYAVIDHSTMHLGEKGRSFNLCAGI